MLRQLALVTLTLPTAIVADFDISRYSSGSSYELLMSNMPDFDQQRTGLANDGGMHCVPTANANLFAYAANHGFPGLAPGQSNWQSNSNHAAGTNFIDRLGDAMGTSGNFGTYHGNAWRGVRQILREEGFDDIFVVEHESTSVFNRVLLKEIAQAGVLRNAIQTICYGRYDNLGTNCWGNTVLARDGGHCMTVVGVERDGNDRTITYHDPWTSDSINQQSTFTATTRNAPFVNDLVRSSSVFWSCLQPLQGKGMNRIMRNLNSSQERYIDSRIAIRPSQCYAWGNFDDGTPTIVTVPSDWWNNTLFEQAVPASPQEMLKPMIDPSGNLSMMAFGGNPRLLLTNRNSEESRLKEVERDLWFPTEEWFPAGEWISLNNVDEATWANDRTLVLRDGRRLVAVGGLDGGLDAENPERGFVAWEATLPEVPTKILAVPSNLQGRNGVLAFSTDMKNLVEVSAGPDQEPKMQNYEVDDTSVFSGLNSNFLNFVGTGTESDCSPTNQDGCNILIDIFHPGAGEVVQLVVPAESGTVRTKVRPILGGPNQTRSSLAVNDAGHYLFTEGGSIKVYAPIMRANGMVLEPIDSPFNGAPAGGGLLVDRSTTNFDPVEHSVENGWFDLAGGDIEEEAFCPSDVNRDGNVDFSDILKVLGDWGCVQGCSGDANEDVVVNFEDIITVLNHWGGC